MAGGGCPAGFHLRSSAPQIAHEKATAIFHSVLPSCEDLEESLRKCRDGVARRGKGHCLSDVMELKRCRAERERVRSLVTKECKTSSAKLGRCFQEVLADESASGDNEGLQRCRDLINAFEKCARETIK